MWTVAKCLRKALYISDRQTCQLKHFRSYNIIITISNMLGQAHVCICVSVSVCVSACVQCLCVCVRECVRA